MPHELKLRNNGQIIFNDLVMINNQPWYFRTKRARIIELNPVPEIIGNNFYLRVVRDNNVTYEEITGDTSHKLQKQGDVVMLAATLCLGAMASLAIAMGISL